MSAKEQLFGKQELDKEPLQEPLLPPGEGATPRGAGQKSGMERVRSNTGKSRRSTGFSKNLHEDSEDSEIDPTPPPVVEPPKPEEPKLGCCKRLWNFLVLKYRRTFFLNFNKYFGDNYEAEASDLGPVDEIWQVQYEIKLFENSWRYTEKKKLKGTEEEKKRVLDEMSRDPNRQINLSWVYFRTVKWDFMWAVIFRLLKQFTGIMIPYVMSQFMKEMQSMEQMDLVYAVLFCLLASFMTFWKEAWGQLCLRWTSLFRGRLLDEIEYNFYMKMIDTNADFLSKVDSSFVQKMMMFEVKPIANYLTALVSMISAPISITFAFAVIALEFETNIYGLLIFAYFIVMCILIYILHRNTILLRKRYRALGSQCTGEIEEFIQNTRLVRTNSMQNLMMHNIWGVRREQRRAMLKIHAYESVFDLIFTSPLLMGSLLLIGIQRSEYGENLDARTLFTIVGTIGSLRGVLSSMSEALSAYQDYVPAYGLFDLFWNSVSRTPKITEKSRPEDPTLNEYVPFDKDIDKKPKEQLPQNIKKLSVYIAKDTKYRSYQIQTNSFVKALFRSDYLGAPTPFPKRPVFDLPAVEIHTGRNVCLVGKEHSGYEAVLKALLGEVELESGRIIVRGKASFIDLGMFDLVEESFQENIVLDSLMNKRRFDKICSVVGLDFNRMAGGEYGRKESNPSLTELEKVKILLARALYQPHEIMVFGRFFDELNYEDRVCFFQNVVMSYLQFNTVVYYTHDRLLVEKADYVYVFDEGKVVDCGTPTELFNKTNSLFNQLISKEAKFKNILNYNTPNKLIERMKKRRNAIFGMSPKILEEINKFTSDDRGNRFYKIAITLLFLHRKIKQKTSQRKKLKIPSTSLLTKSIPRSLTKFANLHGRWTMPAIMFLFFLSGLLTLCWDVWIGWWGADFLQLPDLLVYFEVLIWLSGVTSAYVLIRDLNYNQIMRSVSTDFFFSAVKKMVRANVRWFDNFSTPLILYNMTQYQMTIDEDFNKGVFSLANSAIMLLFGLTIANFFFPGILLIVTIIVLIYARSIVYKVIRTNRITMIDYLQARVDWFGSFVATLKHAASMRMIGRDRYMYKKYEKPSLIIENSSSAVYTYCNRWLGIRAAGISSFLVFWIYLCPVIFAYFPIYDFKHNPWLLGLVLTWSGRLSDYISDLIGNVVNLQVTAEGGERLIELQQSAPKSAGNSRFIDTTDCKDELTENELQDIFLHKSELKSFDYLPHPSFRVIDLENVTYKSRTKVELDNLTFEAFYEDKIALVQLKGSSIETFLDIILGFKLPKEIKKPTTLGGNISTVGQEMKINVFGRPVGPIDRYKLRRKFFNLAKDCPLFSGTLADNIDPYRLYKSEDIVHMLHFFGFVKAYEAYMEINSGGDIGLKVDRTSLRAPEVRRGIASLWSRSTSRAQMERRSTNSAIEIDLVDSSIYCESDTARRARKKVVLVVKVIIVFSRALKDTRKRRARAEEESHMMGSLDRHGLTMNNRKDMGALFKNIGNPKALTKGLYNWGRKKLKDPLSESFDIIDEVEAVSEDKSISIRGSSRLPGSTLQGYTIEKPQERYLIERLLDCRLSAEDKKCPLAMRRIIWLTKALLEQPEVLILDEDALEMEYAPVGYLDAVFEQLAKITVLCRINSFQILDRFTKCATFDEKSMVEFGSVIDLLTDPESLTYTKAADVDTQKLNEAVERVRMTAAMNLH